MYLQAYNSAGVAAESETQINTTTNGFQLFSDVAMHDDTQDAVFVWQDGMRNTTGTNDGDDYGIFMQRVLLDIGDIPVAVCQDITAYLDGSGNVTVPATDVDGGSTSNVTITSYELSDSTFTCSDIGNNTETLTVTNSDNNSDNCTAIITVADSTAPAAVCGNITAYIYSAGSVTISTADIDGGTSDNCQANLSLSKSTFTCSEIGANTLTMYATDPSGNTDSCATVLTVLDTVSPTITCVNDISANVNAGQCIATVSYGTITGDDNCSSTGVTTMLTSGLGSGGNFPIGVSTEVWTATDSSGNIQSCSFTITVTDNVAPTAVCQDLTVFLDGIGSATISENDINNGSSDDCSSVSVSIDINSFSCLETGANNVVLTATDVSTNSANCTATVTVSDTTFPVASCPADTSLDTDAGVCGAVLNYSATGTDNCGSPTISLSSGIGSGGTFTPGITTETYNIADASGNQVSCSFTVTVTDIEAPIIVCPDNITVSNDVGMCDAVVTYGPPGGVDNCPGETISMLSLIHI